MKIKSEQKGVALTAITGSFTIHGSPKPVTEVVNEKVQLTNAEQVPYWIDELGNTTASAKRPSEFHYPKKRNMRMDKPVLVDGKPVLSQGEVSGMVSISDKSDERLPSDRLPRFELSELPESVQAKWNEAFSATLAYAKKEVGL